MEKIKLVYIDNESDPYISHYIHASKRYASDKIEVNVEEIGVTGEDDVMSLIKKPVVKNANILLLDSRLFVDENVTKKIKGEQVMLVLKKLNPFIKVLIISQHEDTRHIGVIPKFKPKKMDKTTVPVDNNQVAIEYYNERLAPRLKTAIKSILKYRKIRAEIPKEETMKVVLDQIDELMSGDFSYTNIKQADIDKLIIEIKNLEVGDYE